MLNQITAIGRVARDLTLSYTSTGKEYTRFKLVVQRSRANADGKHDADAFWCVAWGKTAANGAKYVQQGSQICIQGALQSSTYKNRNGENVESLEVNVSNIEFLQLKRAAAQADAEQDAPAGSAVPDQRQEEHPRREEAAPAQNLNAESIDATEPPAETNDLDQGIADPVGYDQLDLTRDELPY